MARFVAISLIVDIDPDEEDILLGDNERLPPPANPARQRWLFHETLHLWQQASCAFLIRCTEEDWSRMRLYEQGGDLRREGVLPKEYLRVDPEAEFRAIDLQECLARYWELQAFSPLSVLTDAVASKQVIDEELRPFLESPAQHLELPFGLAMKFIAGQYAEPYLKLSKQAGTAAATGLFPLAAFFALQTDSPVRFYTRLVNSVVQTLGQHRVTSNPADRNWYSSVRRRADEVHQEMFGAGLGFGLDVLRASGLLEHPGYAYLLECMENFVAQATRAHDFLHQALQQNPRLFTDLAQRSREIQARYDETARAAIAKMGGQAGQSCESSQRATRASAATEPPKVVIPPHAAPVVSAPPELPTPRWFAEFAAACPQSTSALGVPQSMVRSGPGAPTTVLSDHFVPPCIRAGQRIVPNFPLLMQRHSGATELANGCLEVERRWRRFREACLGF